MISRPLAAMLLGSAVFSAALTEAARADAPRPALTGVNLAGAEFNPSRVPGRVGTDYVYPTAEEIRYFAASGANILRIPVLWERLQPRLDGPLDPAEIGRLTTVLDAAHRHRVAAIIDVHNYARYRENTIGSPAVSIAQFAGLWKALARTYGKRPDVIFGLMNEPRDIASEEWRQIVDAALTAIRSTGARNLVLVPGVAWMNARNYVSGGYGTPNAVALAGITDPANNFAYEVHQYVNPGFNGNTGECLSTADSVVTLRDFTHWLRSTKQRGFLGEFATGSGAHCLEVLETMLSYMQENSDVWLGWTYWAAGPWWGEYHFSVEPTDGAERPQMTVLKRFFHGRREVPG
jgi:endoglucanase